MVSPISSLLVGSKGLNRGRSRGQHQKAETFNPSGGLELRVLFPSHRTFAIYTLLLRDDGCGDRISDWFPDSFILGH
jgi:hypothetical protein